MRRKSHGENEGEEKEEEKEKEEEEDPPSGLPDVLAPAAMRYFQNTCDTAGRFSVSNDFLQAAENLESRLVPCVELM